jgi:hypothetical protein
MGKTARDFYESLKERLEKEHGGTWYSVSPQDFEGLLTEPRVKDLLKDWFNILIKIENNKPIALLPTGEVVDLDKIYIDIESDPDMSFYIYQIGMSIWR